MSKKDFYRKFHEAYGMLSEISCLQSLAVYFSSCFLRRLADDACQAKHHEDVRTLGAAFGRKGNEEDWEARIEGSLQLFSLAIGLHSTSLTFELRCFSEFFKILLHKFAMGELKAKDLLCLPTWML